MYFKPIFEVLPKISDTQVRRILIPEGFPKIAEGEYAFLPLYCEDPKCDCRRAMVKVFTPTPAAAHATISYGWESKEFYFKHFPFLEDKALTEFKGPALDAFQPQGPDAKFWLKEFKTMLKDQAYADRYISLYTKFKWEIGMKIPKDLQPYLGLMEHCLCGSGKRYKSCCGAKRARRLRRR